MIKITDLVGHENMFIGLNLGCGNNCIDGWLNTDLYPVGGGVYMDATHELPFNDNSFRYVFCEHMFEHLTVAEGLELLKEVHRILQPDGIFRIALPTKDKLDEIYNDEVNNKEYIDFHFSHFDRESPIKNACIMLNNFYRMWGHKTIYDKQTLIELFKLGGFNKVTEYNVNESDDSVLTNIESHDKEIGKFNILETSVFELQKL